MLLLDNSVLSAFTKLGLLNSFQYLSLEIRTTRAVINEYTEVWQKENIPSWLHILFEKESLSSSIISSKSLSSTDLSLLSLAVKEKALLATDDKALREAAKKLSVKVIGSLGLLRLLYTKGIIKKKSHYLSFLDKLQEDLYLQKDLLGWAKKDL